MQVGDWLLVHDFVIITNEESDALRRLQAKEALAKLGSVAALNEDGLPTAAELD